MGDLRYDRHLERLRAAPDIMREMRDLPDDEVIQALAAASRANDPLLSNVLATEALNRVYRATTVADTIAEGTYAVNTEGRITSVNPAGAHLLGWTRAEVVGTIAFDTLELLRPSGEPLPRDEWPLWRAMSQGRTLEGEIRIIRRDGTSFPALYAWAPIRREDDVEGAVLTVRDITERVRLENTLRFLASATESLGASLDYRTTLETVARLAVPEFADWCTIHLVSDGIPELVAIAHRDPDKVRLARRLATQYPSSDENRGVRKVIRTGEPDLVSHISDEMLSQAAQGEEHLQLLRDLGLSSYMAVPLQTRGRILGALSFVWAESAYDYTATDVAFATDLARRAGLAIENADLYGKLREASEKFAHLARIANDGLWEWDARRNKTTYSARWRETFGYAADEAPESLESWREIIHSEDRDRTYKHLDDFLAGRIAEFDIENRMRCKDGTWRRMRIRAALIRDENGAPKTLIGVNTDVTDLR